jgi:hypothetical protein
MHALLLAVEGPAILSLWNARGEFDDVDASAADVAPRAAPRRAIEFALAILLALLASWAGLRATLDVSRQIGLVSGGFVSALLVAPALILPMIGSGMMLARANLYSGAVSASVGIVLLNLCSGERPTDDRSRRCRRSRRSGARPVGSLPHLAVAGGHGRAGRAGPGPASPGLRALAARQVRGRAARVRVRHLHGPDDVGRPRVNRPTRWFIIRRDEH